jgi:hypothetical protein
MKLESTVSNSRSFDYEIQDTPSGSFKNFQINL